MRANLESLNIGDTFLTKYEIRGLIGRGGQATVYRCHDTFIDREVAIKVMVDSFDTKREHSRRAQMEARVLCKLHHPNIVHVYDAGATDSGAIYIIMELLKGRTLRDVLRELRSLSVYETLSIGAQIADGVELAHREHVIHRDLKPENVFIVDGNTVKVLDFGIAKFLTLTGITTQRDTLQGTMWYISPEHVQGHGVTPRSDVYALGCILYEAISGTPPCLVGLQEISTQSVAWSQITRVPPHLDKLNPAVPGHVARLIQHMLVKEPSERPSSMAEVADALRAAGRRLQTESSGKVMTVRDLWNEQPASAPIDGTSEREIARADTARDPRAIPVLQPTVEVRQNELVLDTGAASRAHAQGPAPAESGIIVQDPSAADAGSISGPSGIATPRPAAPQESLASARAALNDSGVATGSFFSNRRRLLVIAILLGTVLGVGLGFSNRFRSRLTTNHSATASEPAAVSSAAPIGDQSHTARPTGMAARPDAATPPQGAHVSPSILPSTANNPAHTMRARPPPVPAPAGSKTSAGGGPKPRYTVDDLE